SGACQPRTLLCGYADVRAVVAVDIPAAHEDDPRSRHGTTGRFGHSGDGGSGLSRFAVTGCRLAGGAEEVRSADQSRRGLTLANRVGESFRSVAGFRDFLPSFQDSRLTLFFVEAPDLSLFFYAYSRVVLQLRQVGA